MVVGRESHPRGLMVEHRCAAVNRVWSIFVGGLLALALTAIVQHSARASYMLDEDLNSPFRSPTRFLGTDRSTNDPSGSSVKDAAKTSLTKLLPTGQPAAPAQPLSRAPEQAVRLQIPRLGVDAPIITLGVDRNGAMETPESPEVVAWYNFSALPGAVGNAVFSGHRDWRTGVTAVFWRLGELRAGDVILIVTPSAELRYTVQTSELYENDQAPVAQIVGGTSFAAVTLITCEGLFDRASRNYSQRRVVRAELS